MRYLQVMGRLYPDNRLVLRRGYLDEKPRRRVVFDSELEAQFYNEEGRLLLSHPLALQPFCHDGASSPELGVRGWAPFHPDTRTIRFSRRGIVIHEIAVSREEPRVDLTWRPPAEVRGAHTVSWNGGHSGGMELEYFCRYSHDDGRTWQRIGWRTRASSFDFDADELPGGERCRVAVVATDGINTTIAESASFHVAVKPCQPLILAPLDGARLQEGRPVLLHGQGYYLEERRPELEAIVWTSSRDGGLGRRALLEAGPLSPGDHRLSMTAGAGARASRVHVDVVVETRGEIGSSQRDWNEY